MAEVRRSRLVIVRTATGVDKATTQRIAATGHVAI